MKAAAEIITIEDGVLGTGDLAIPLTDIVTTGLSESANWSMLSRVLYISVLVAIAIATLGFLLPYDPRKKTTTLLLTLVSGRKIEIARGDKAFLERIQATTEEAKRMPDKGSYRIDLVQHRIEHTEPDGRP